MTAMFGTDETRTTRARLPRFLRRGEAPSRVKIAAKL